MQLPRVRNTPLYRSTAGTEAAELAESAGLHLDPWQRLALDDMLGERTDSKWASFEVGILVARQNGKGAIIEARELAGMFLFSDKLIVHSAHEFKDLDISTPIMTSRGWSTMGDLSAGDEVFAPTGQLTKIVAAHPTLNDSDCYRVTFADGQSLVTGGGHLWAVNEVDRAGNVTARVVTTDEVRTSGLTHRWLRRGAARDRTIYRWRVALPGPVHFPPANLPIDPYLLGTWLGDGDSAGGRITVGVADLEALTDQLDALGETYRVSEDKRTDGRVFSVGVVDLKKRLRAAGVLGAKRIPEAYFAASVEQRRALLAGIMDTDGTVSGHQLAVTMIKPDLMSDIATLVRSLGYRATERTFRARLNGADAGPMYRVQFAPTSVSPFRLARKTEKIRRLKPTRSQYNAIVSVEPVPIRQTRCITVAHESGCYLAGRGFIPTHNTAQEAFLRIKALIDNTDSLRRRVKMIRTAHGEEGIELRDGTRLRFMARSRSSGRGFSGDTMILDEAQELPLSAMAALLPTLSARPNPQIIYTGTVPAPENDSEHFTSVRDRGRSGISKSLAWLEWSPGEEWSDLNDRRAWARANPARGYRITDEFIEREREALSTPDFLRERLSVWPKNSAGSVISATEWRGRLDAGSQAMNPVVLALDIPPNRECASIASAGRRAAGGVHLEVIDRQAGTGWVVARLKELNQTWKPRAVIVDSAGPAASLIAELTAAGVPVVTTSAREMAQACGALYDAIQNGQVWHIGQPELDDAVAAATKRPLQDAWAWQRKGTTDISPLVAVTLAYHGHLTTPSYSALDSVW